MIDNDKPNFITELRTLVDKISAVAAGTGGKDSFEMKQNAAGRRYYDIKMYRIDGESTASYIARFDELDKELKKRSILGE